MSRYELYGQKVRVNPQGSREVLGRTHSTFLEGIIITLLCFLRKQ